MSAQYSKVNDFLTDEAVVLVMEIDHSVILLPLFCQTAIYLRCATVEKNNLTISFRAKRPVP